jgi:hypothetical protein
MGYVDEIVRGYTSSVEPIITSRESILCRLIDFETVFTLSIKYASRAERNILPVGRCWHRSTLTCRCIQLLTIKTSRKTVRKFISITCWRYIFRTSHLLTVRIQTTMIGYIITICTITRLPRITSAISVTSYTWFSRTCNAGRISLPINHDTTITSFLTITSYTYTRNIIYI